MLSAAETWKILVEKLRKRKERLLPYFPSSRKTFSARQLWAALPSEVKEQEFRSGFYRFKDFLTGLALEDADSDGEFFRVQRIANGKGSSRFRLLRPTTS